MSDQDCTPVPLWCKYCRRFRLISDFPFRKDKPDQRRTRCSECSKAVDESSKKMRSIRRNLVLAAYGGKCAECGKSDKLLHIDHVNNDGREHRKTFSTHDITYLIIKEGFPEGYQLLCPRCHSKKHHSSSTPGIQKYSTDVILAELARRGLIVAKEKPSAQLKLLDD